jgi:hypothetical protein
LEIFFKGDKMRRSLFFVNSGVLTMCAMFIFLFQIFISSPALFCSESNSVVDFYSASEAEKISSDVGQRAFSCVLESLRTSLQNLGTCKFSSEGLSEEEELTEEDKRISNIINCVEIIKDISQYVPIESQVGKQISRVLEHASVDDRRFLPTCNDVYMELRGGG